MKPLHAQLSRLASIVAAALAAGLAPVASGTAAAQSRDATIGVHAGYYVVAGGAIDDLDTLESDLRVADARSLQIDVCDDSAARALLAAIERFSDLQLSFRFAGAASPSCTVTKLAMRAGLRSGPQSYGIDDARVQRYWRSVSP
jgi:hypothetical protein